MGRITQWRVGFDDQRALKKKETDRGSLRGSAHCCPRAQWRIMSRRSRIGRRPPKRNVRSQDQTVVGAGRDSFGGRRMRDAALEVRCQSTRRHDNASATTCLFALLVSRTYSDGLRWKRLLLAWSLVL